MCIRCGKQSNEYTSLGHEGTNLPNLLHLRTLSNVDRHLCTARIKSFKKASSQHIIKNNYFEAIDDVEV